MQNTRDVTEAEISQQFATLITNAAGIVAALAWSDALTSLFTRLQIFKNNPLLGPFVYAAILTVAAYMLSRALSGLAKQPCTRLCPRSPDAT